MNKLLKPFLLTLTLLLAGGLAAIAQAPGGGGPTPAAPTNTPLDGGASLLLAGGVAYGIRQIRARRAAKQASKL